jgi:hypothetical protein
MPVIAQKIALKTVPELCVYSINVHDQMAANVAVFPAPPIPLKDFNDRIIDLLKAEAATLMKTSTSYQIRDDKYTIVVNDLNKLGNYVQDQSQGNVTIIKLAGMDVRKTPQKTTGLDAPLIMDTLSPAPGVVDVKLSSWSSKSGKLAVGNNLECYML